jgi:hypothetical protein
MTVTIIVAVVGLIGILGGALGSFLVSAKKMGGKVSSTEAADLWIEARQLREDATRRILRLEERAALLDEKVAALTHENFDLLVSSTGYESEIKRLVERVEEQNKEITDLRKIITDLQEQLRKERE